VSPDPPQPGQNLTVKVTGLVKEVIEVCRIIISLIAPRMLTLHLTQDGAYADVTVKLGLIKLLKKEFDLCEEAQNANMTVQCPVEAGTYTIEQTVELPKEIPKGAWGCRDRFDATTDRRVQRSSMWRCLRLPRTTTRCCVSRFLLTL
jgi:hypothetical protein